MRLFQDHGETIAADPSFTTVFDGSLYLADRRFVIGDGMGESRFVKYIGDYNAGECGARWTTPKATRVLPTWSLVLRSRPAQG